MIIPIIQVVVAILLIILIVLQERSAGLSTLFGGESGFYQTRRGVEKIVFVSTIVLTVVFVVLAILQLIY